MPTILLNRQGKRIAQTNIAQCPRCKTSLYWTEDVWVYNVSCHKRRRYFCETGEHEYWADESLTQRMTAKCDAWRPGMGQDGRITATATVIPGSAGR